MNLYDATTDPLYWIAVVAVFIIATASMLMWYKSDMMAMDDPETMEKETENSKHFHIFVAIAAVGYVIAAFDALFIFVRWLT